jgi:hypothetical protein
MLRAQLVVVRDSEGDVMRRWVGEHLEQLGFMPVFGRARGSDTSGLLKSGQIAHRSFE